MQQVSLHTREEKTKIYTDWHQELSEQWWELLLCCWVSTKVTRDNEEFTSGKQKKNPTHLLLFFNLPLKEFQNRKACSIFFESKEILIFRLPPMIEVVSLVPKYKSFLVLFCLITDWMTFLKTLACDHSLHQPWKLPWLTL